MKVQLPPTVNKFLGILRAEEGPEVLPRSVPLLVASLTFFAVAQFLTKLFTHPPLRAAGIGLIGVIVLAAIAFACSRLFRRADRLPQILTAMAAGGAAVAIVNLVVRLLLKFAFHEMDMDILPVDSIVNFLVFPLFLWNVLVYVSIFRRGLSAGMILSFAMSFALTLAIVFWIPLLLKV
ncbi:hypothetical protein [Methylocapsa palsarum]|uniref:Yip1 domain-containing protein n=1 Tax=Methylocapsa palsarum TaxID=1612308 RepID=A0A1I3Z8K5_9HYPH|nr:hypothetical protein [Methylocapsa palsarum]SFK40458.1 hypothetical protein SAMN05444581_107163 [Methylocapsa palsarum]